MKIRTDFVSNSSSSSFIIKKDRVEKAMMKYSSEFNDTYVPYEVDEEVEVMIYTKNKWFAEVSKAFGQEIDAEEFMLYYDYKTGKHIQKDPEDIGWDSITVSLQKFAEPVSADIIQKIDHIMFITRDDSGSNGTLYGLYIMFRILGCDPDDSESEKSIRPGDSDFMKKLYSIIAAGRETVIL